MAEPSRTLSVIHLLSALWRWYWLLIAAGAIVCWITAAFWLVASLGGLPLP